MPTVCSIFVLTTVLIIIYLCGMYICLCHGVTERQIREAVMAGADSLPDVSAALGVATCCGTCSCAAQSVIDEARCQLAGHREPQAA